MKTAKVTGTYTYLVNDVPRTLSLGVHATDPVKGTWTWFHPAGTYSGPASCVRIDGDEAWVAGPSWDGTFAVFIYVHDGGTPGREGDTAFTWGADPWETLQDMEALCEAMQPPPFYGLMPFDVVSGNANVWDAE
jgi:hypothetical protein